MIELCVSVDVAAPNEQVWAAFTDVDRQSEWMFATKVEGTAQGGRGVGGELTAVTGAGRLHVVDTMRVTEWDPPRRWAVEHTGRLIRGTATVVVLPRDQQSTVIWTERLVPPLGALGETMWPVVRPAARRMLRHALDRFAAWAPEYPA